MGQRQHIKNRKLNWVIAWVLPENLVFPEALPSARCFSCFWHLDLLWGPWGSPACEGEHGLQCSRAQSLPSSSPVNSDLGGMLNL